MHLRAGCAPSTPSTTAPVRTAPGAPGRADQSLWDAAEAQSGGGRSAYPCLVLALVALPLRDHLPVEAFTAWYELVEPVIPAATVDR